MSSVVRPSRWRRRLLLLSLAAGAFVLFRVPLLVAIADAMVVDTSLQRADLVVAVYQDSSAVAPAVAMLMRNGHAPRVALLAMAARRLETRGLIPPAHVTLRERLERAGVPAPSIIVLGTSIRTAREGALAIAAEAPAAARLRVTIVTPRLSSRIALIDARRAFRGLPVDLQIHAAPSRTLDENTWWRSSDGIVTVFDTYCLWFLRLIR